MEGYKQFQETVKNRILEYMPDSYHFAVVKIQDILKNNNQKYVGMIITNGEQELTPILDLEQYYRELQEGASEQSIMKKIADTYLHYEHNAPAFTIDSLLDFEKLKDQIYIEIINESTNQERLQGHLRKNVIGTDLAAVMYIYFQNEKREDGKILVCAWMARQWQTDPEILFQMAFENTVAQIPVYISGLKDMLSGQPAKSLQEFYCEKDALYVLSNMTVNGGATALIYPGVLQTLADNCQSGFYILPSSVHEVLLMRDDGKMEAWELQRLVRDINRSIVLTAEEILSDRVYHYDREEQSLSMAAIPERTEEELGFIKGFSGEWEENPDVELER